MFVRSFERIEGHLIKSFSIENGPVCRIEIFVGNYQTTCRKIFLMIFAKTKKKKSFKKDKVS